MAIYVRESEFMHEKYMNAAERKQVLGIFFPVPIKAALKTTLNVTVCMNT